MATQQDATELIREHAAFVWRVLRHVGVAENQLEDLSQEVFMVIVQQLPTYGARASVRTWIYGICWNVASTARRRARVRNQPEVERMAELAAPASQEREVWVKQAHAELVQALEALDPEQRTVFILYEFGDLSMEEIAQALASPITTCYSRLYTARSKVEASVRRKLNLMSSKTMRVAK